MNLNKCMILINMDKYVKKHIYGEGIFDCVKSLFGKTATKTGEYASKKAGDKIVHLLRKKNKMPTIPKMEEEPKASPMTEYEMSERLNQIPSGGKLRKMKLI